MSEVNFDSAVESAGAIGVFLERASGKLSLIGDGKTLGLRTEIEDIDSFCKQIAPGDQARVKRIVNSEPCDSRLRILGYDHTVRYARLMGKTDDHGNWQGLLVPAGVYPCTGRNTIDLETALRIGLETGEVLAYHQPIVDLKSRHLVGFEALARWDRVDGDILSPDEFLPLAAEQGLISEIGTQIREGAIRDGAAWHLANAEMDGLFVAANATAGEICEAGFADTLIAVLEKSGLAPERFKLELSETEVMRDPDAAERTMKTIQEAGISLALDDFGTGYSSLSRLDRFPFDSIKIDQYFVRSAMTDPSTRSIVASVVSIARSYGMMVVAEGIETEESAQQCLELGCDFGQGYRFSRAMKPQDAAQAVMNGVENRFQAPVTKTLGVPASGA
jgi:EAL domain-containing protein (putative c-di-GMP-specific phosphodiesterase class I)